MASEPYKPDAFLEQFPMFYPADTLGLAGYRWKHPDDPDRRVFLYASTRTWCVVLSDHHERALAIPRSAYDGGDFETAEAAAAWLLLEGLITCGAYRPNRNQEHTDA